MASVTLSPVLNIPTFQDNDGAPLAGGKIYAYVAGSSTTLQATYSSPTGDLQNTNPIILDSSGRLNTTIFLETNKYYRLVVTNSDNTPLSTFDNVVGTGQSISASTITAETVTATQGQTLVPLTNSYAVASNTLEISLNGAVQVSGTDYLETTSTSITFNTGLNAGDVVLARIFKVNAGSAVSAAVVSVADAGNYFTGNNVETVLQEVGFKQAQRVSVKDFGAVGNDTTNDTTALLNAIAHCSSTGAALFFPAGTYKFSTPLLFDYSFGEVIFEGKVVLHYTATGAYAVAVDGGASVADGGDAGFVWRFSFGEGNAPLIRAPLATAAMLTRSVHHSHIEFACDAAVTTVLQANFCVCTEFVVTASHNEQPFIVRPQHGMLLDARENGNGFADCIMRNCVIEGVASDGVISTFAQDCTWIGGTSEGNGGKGYVERTASSAANTLIGFDCESNGDLDFDLGGVGTYLINCVGSSPSKGVEISGNANHIFGGRFSKINVGAGVGNVIEGCYFLDTLDSGGFIDSGFNTVLRDLRIATFNNALAIPDKSRPPKLKVLGAVTIASITRATECIVTFAENFGLDYGDTIIVSNPTGMVELNGAYQVEPTSDASNAVRLLAGGAYVNSSAFTPFIAGTGTLTTLNAPWVAFGGSFRSPSYSKDANGYVHLSGSIKGGVSNTIAFTLPAGWRPAADVVFTTANFNVPNTTFIRVTGGGDVFVVNDTNTAHIALDGVVFKAEQ